MRGCIDDVAKDIVVLDGTYAVVETDANMDLIGLLMALSIFCKSALHPGRSFDRSHRVVEFCKNRVADSFYDGAPRGLDDWKQDAVVPGEHRHVFDVALLFGVAGRALDVAKEDGYRRA